MWASTSRKARRGGDGDETVRRVYLGGGSRPRPARSPRSTTQTPFLEVENVNVHYGKAQALEDVSIHVHTGEFVSVVGLNGAGKTTLFNAISGLVPYSGRDPLEGRRCAADAPPRSRAAGIVQCPEAASCSST